MVGGGAAKLEDGKQLPAGHPVAKAVHAALPAEATRADLARLRFAADAAFAGRREELEAEGLLLSGGCGGGGDD